MGLPQRRWRALEIEGVVAVALGCVLWALRERASTASAMAFCVTAMAMALAVACIVWRLTRWWRWLLELEAAGKALRQAFADEAFHSVYPSVWGDRATAEHAIGQLLDRTPVEKIERWMKMAGGDAVARDRGLAGMIERALSDADMDMLSTGRFSKGKRLGRKKAAAHIYSLVYRPADRRPARGKAGSLWRAEPPLADIMLYKNPGAPQAPASVAGVGATAAGVCAQEAR